MKKIAIDAMGGEKAPEAIVSAVVKFAKEAPNDQFVLFGQEKLIRKYLPKGQIAQIEIINTTEVIEDEDEPVRAIRRKKDASMVVAANYVKAGKADALFSMSNTGALLACGIFIIGRLHGIARPALMPTLPTKDRNKGFNLIDVGANAQTKPEYFLRWAQMADVYAKKVRGLTTPRLALLNNGAEADKGDPVHQAAFDLLKNSSVNFIGNIEGNELLSGKADIVLADGFSGNIALKTIEGTAEVILTLLKSALLESGFKSKVGALLAKPALQDLKNQFDTAQYGGAVLLGVKAPVVKTHGRSDERPIYYTLRQIDKMLVQDVIGDFSRQFSTLTN